MHSETFYIFLQASLNKTSETPAQQQPVEDEEGAMERCVSDFEHSSSAREEQVEALDVNDFSEAEMQHIEDDRSLDETMVAPHSNELSHPQIVWRQMTAQLRTDSFHYGRNPALWFTLNYPYNYVFELHRLQEATRESSVIRDQIRHMSLDERISKQWTHGFSGQPTIAI